MTTFNAARGSELQTRAPRADRRSENRFFTGYVIALTALIFAGFAPTFYLRGIMPAQAALTPLMPLTIAHGIIATLFMAAFPLQGLLAGLGRIRQHMLVGKAALGLAASMIPLGYVMGAASYHGHPEMDDAFATAFTALPLFGSVTLAIALPLVWFTRFEAQTHKRLIVCLACMMADPAIFRLPLVGARDAGLLIAQLIMVLTLVPLFVRDLVVDGRIHRGTLMGAGLFAAIMVVRTLVMPTAAWAEVVHALPLYGMR